MNVVQPGEVSLPEPSSDDAQLYCRVLAAIVSAGLAVRATRPAATDRRAAVRFLAANPESHATTGSDSEMAANRAATDSATGDSAATGPAGADRAARDCQAAGRQALAETVNLRASLEAGWMAVAARASADHAAGPLAGSVAGLAPRGWLAAAKMTMDGSASREIARARSTDSARRIRA